MAETPESIAREARRSLAFPLVLVAIGGAILGWGAEHFAPWIEHGAKLVGVVIGALGVGGLGAELAVGEHRRALTKESTTTLPR